MQEQTFNNIFNITIGVSVLILSISFLLNWQSSFSHIASELQSEKVSEIAASADSHILFNQMDYNKRVVLSEFKRILESNQADKFSEVILNQVPSQKTKVLVEDSNGVTQIELQQAMTLFQNNQIKNFRTENQRIVFEVVYDQ